MFLFCIFLIFLPFQLLKLRLVRDRIFGHAKRPSINNVGGANTGNMETSEKLSRPQGRMREAIDGTGGDRARGAFSKTTKVSGRSDLREARACTIRWRRKENLINISYTQKGDSVSEEGAKHCGQFHVHCECWGTSPGKSPPSHREKLCIPESYGA